MMLWCVKNGVPKEEVENWGYWELLVHSVVFGEFESGKQWDWVSYSMVSKIE